MLCSRAYFSLDHSLNLHTVASGAELPPPLVATGSEACLIRFCVVQH